MKFTLGPTIKTVPYHIPIIRSQLTRNLTALLPVVYEELVDAFDQVIPACENGRSLLIKAKILFLMCYEPQGG